MEPAAVVGDLFPTRIPIIELFREPGDSTPSMVLTQCARISTTKSSIVYKGRAENNTWMALKICYADHPDPRVHEIVSAQGREEYKL